MRKISLGILVAASLIAAGCADDPTDTTPVENTIATPPPDDAEATDDPGEPAGGGEGTAETLPEVAVTVEPTPYSPIAAGISVVADEPVKVRIRAESADHEAQTPTTADALREHFLPLVGMRQDRTYALTIEILTEDGALIEEIEDTFTTGTVPYPLPDFDVEVDLARSQPGITIIEFNPGNPPDDVDPGQPVIGLDNEGEVVWWYRNTGAVGDVRATDRGTFLSHYFPVGVREFDLLGNVVGNWQVSPEPPDTTVEIRDADALAGIASLFGGNEGDPPPIPVKADWVDLTSIHHEVFPMPDGNLLTLSTTNHPLTPEQRSALCPDDEIPFAATSDVVVEFQPDGTVVRTWDLWDVLDVEGIPGPFMCSTDGLFESVDFRDWTHANAVVYDEKRDAILISVRHTDQVIALDHLDETGPQSSVRWILGRQGTIPLDGDAPYHPHAVEVQDDGSILLYDNGNLRPGTSPDDPENPPYSRAVQYTIDDTADDPDDWTATQVWEHRVDDFDGEPLFAFFLGDVDRMDNGNVLINHGGIWNRPGFQHVLIIEVVPEGESGGDIVWELAIGTEADPVTVYRAERLPTLSCGPEWET